MTKPMATPCTQRELAFWSYWTDRGYQFKRSDKIPLNTVTPPGFAVNHPVLDALGNVFVLAGAMLIILVTPIYFGVL